MQGTRWQLPAHEMVARDDQLINAEQRRELDPRELRCDDGDSIDVLHDDILNSMPNDARAANVNVEVGHIE